MAITHKIPDWNPDNYTFNSYDYPIGGKMVHVTYKMSELESTQFADDEFKKRMKSELAYKMAEFIIENKLCEFTRHHDPFGFSNLISMRCYLAPNDQVKILRTAYANI